MRAPRLALALLLGACAPREAPLAEPPSSSPAVAPASASSTAPLSTSPAPAPSPEPAPSAALVPAPSPALVPAPSPAPLPDPHVLLEPPYSALGHPALATEMLTLARDEELVQWALGGSANPAHPAHQPGYHPATRVVIDVELLSRAPKGSTRRLQAVARSSGYWPVRACFEAAQRLAPKTERSARVRLTLSANGRVLGARSFETGSERAYAQCVLARVRNLDFSPGFTRKLDVELKLKQWPGHAPLPPRAPDKEPKLQLSAEARAALEALTPAFSACYREGLVADPELWGRLAFKVKLQDGTVTEAEQVETRFPSESVVGCARQALLGARLPSVAETQLSLALRFGQPPPPAPGAPAVPGSGAPPAPH